MPLEILRNDIANMCVDAIVNTANPAPVVGPGVDAMIHKKAGDQLLKARQRIGDIAVGDAVLTPGFALDAKFVIHTVGPKWQGGDQGEEALLRRCYDRSLALAKKKKCQSVAFPLIASGHYGFPKDRALQIAMAAFSQFLMEEEMQIYLVVFDRDSFRLSEKLFRNVKRFIDQHYADCCQVYAMEESRSVYSKIEAPCATRPASKSMSLKEMLRQADAGFSETLLKKIDETGKKDAEIYKKANLSKQHFSKIRNNPHYKPTKPTAIALALALELDLEQTRDLIGRAGYALTNSSEFDLIVRYFIENRNYDIIEINMTLYEFDQPLLGA